MATKVHLFILEYYIEECKHLHRCLFYTPSGKESDKGTILSLQVLTENCTTENIQIDVDIKSAIKQPLLFKKNYIGTVFENHLITKLKLCGKEDFVIISPCKELGRHLNWYSYVCEIIKGDKLIGETFVD